MTLFRLCNSVDVKSENNQNFLAIPCTNAYQNGKKKLQLIIIQKSFKIEKL